jgi:WD40-like Beta Propeller Repeat
MIRMGRVIRMSLLLPGAACGLLALLACATGPREAPSAGGQSTSAEPPYLGQPPPGTTPALFAPGIVNTDAIELNGVFTPDGGEFFFTRLIDGVDTMFRSVLEQGAWSPPVPLRVYPGRARAVAVDMAVSPNGGGLYFLGQHPHEHAREKPGYDLWVSRRVDGAWTTAQVVPPPVSTPASELYPVVVADGSLYFTSDRPGGLGPSDVYRAQRLPDGRFAAPVNVGEPINGPHGTGDTFVSPDESYAIFSSRRPSGFGNGDLWVSFRQPDGRWGDPVNLGDVINTAEHEFCPMVTPDGKYLFFSRLLGGSWEKATGGEVYWVATTVLDRFRR